MSKKILIIKGSCRKDSFTNTLCQEAIRGLSNIETSVFDTYSEKFNFCTGCNYCEENGKCVHRDLDGFYEEFETADVVVFASPVYNGGFSASIKALIDRFQVYYTSFYKNGKVQPIKKHRKCLLVTAAGRNGEDALSEMEKNLGCAFTILNAELTGSVLCAYTDTVPQYEKALEDLKILLRRSLSDD